MSGPVLAERRPPCLLIQSSSSMSEYTCTDCGRTFRRHATYRRHRQLSHDDITETFGSQHLQLSSLPRRLANVTSSNNIGRGSDVMVDMETVENCCVDNEISLGENSSSAEFQMSCQVEDTELVSKSPCITSPERRLLCTTPLAGSTSHEDTTSSRCQANDDLKSEEIDDPVTVKIEQIDDECIYEDDGELSDFRSTSVDCRLESNAGTRKQLLIKKSESIVFDKKDAVQPVVGTQSNSGGSTRREHMNFDTKNVIPVSVATSVPPEIKWSQVNGGSYMKDEKNTSSSVPISGSISLLATASGATTSSASTAPKIFVYVKTEPQAQYCGTSASAFVSNSTEGRMTMMSDDQMPPPMHSANTKPSGCQFVCPICQRLFNSEKYLSMHMSSIHRAPDSVLQQPHQQSAKQVAAIELAPTPVKFTMSTVVSSSASARRTPGPVTSKPVVPVHTTVRLAASPPRQTSSTEVALVPQCSVTVPAATVAVPQQSSAPTTGAGGVAGNVVLGPTRSSTQWTCNICNKSFAQNSSYKNHIRTHSDDRPYVCSICSIGFKERYHLKKHALFKHTTELNETCRVCGKRFKDSTAVRAHERIHSDVRPYGCTLCGKTFKTSECLWHHENRSKTCGKMAVAAAVSSGAMVGVDSRTVARRQVPQQQQDTRTQGARRQRRTPVAGLTAVTKHPPSIMKSPSTLDEIQSAVAVITSKPLAAQVPETRLLSSVPSSSTASSVIFSQVTGNAQSMLTAETNRRRESSFTQPMVPSPCSIEANNALKNNINSTVEPDMTTPTDSIDCELFDEVGLSSVFGAEVDDEVGQSDLVNVFWPPFDFDQMTSDYFDIYSTDPDMIDSASSTTETASSSSETTDDSEISAAVIDELTKEIRLAAAAHAGSSHTVEFSQSGDVHSTSSVSKTLAVGAGKRHDCARCDKRFASAATLEKHLLVHAEVRPYRCSVCDIGFKLKVHLKKHNLYRHSDDYPCECSVCGKRFKDSSAVRLHERIHSTDRPFQCLHCGKSFKTKENLWGHRNRGPCDKSSMTSTMPSCISMEAINTQSSSSPSRVIVTETPPPSAVESHEVTQHYVANNIRLFHSAEFGPILGVPVNARLVFRDTVNGSDAEGADDTQKSSNSSAVESTVSSSGQVTTSTSTLPVGLPRLSAAAVGPHDTIPIGSPRIVSYASASMTPPVLLPATVPTAVVAPIKRQTATASASLVTGEPVTSSAVPNRPTSLILPSNVRLVMSADQQSNGGRRLVASCTQPQSTNTRKRSNSASIADRCPTVQKYLALGAADGGGSMVPVDGSSLPSTIQKLLQLAVPRTTSLTSVSGGLIHVACSAASAASETLSMIDMVAGSLNSTVSTSVVLSDDVNAKRRCHDNGGGSCVRRENDESKEPAISRPSSLTGSRVTGDHELHDNWNELTAPLEDAHLLADSTDDDDSANFSDSSNYQFIDVVRSAAAIGRSSDNVNQLMCDDDSEGDGCGKLLDPFAGTLNGDYYISSNGGAADMMWCSSGESSWTPDSDLGGLLIFGPN